MIGVTSLAVLFVVRTSPPPAIVAVFVTEAGAFAATATVRVKVALAPPPKALDVLQARGLNVQLQPAGPLNAVAVRPVGSVSLIVISPLVEACPALVTTIVYVSAPSP